MKNIKNKIIDKIKENQEQDVKKYTWDTIPESLKIFWSKQLNNK